MSYDKNSDRLSATEIEDQLSSRALARAWLYPRRIQFQRKMRETATTYFAEMGYEVDNKYPFIVADWDDWPKNIIVPAVVDYIDEVRRRREAASEGFALHKYIHHGLSSQAMLFNLIGPLIVRRDLDLLKAIFGRRELEWPDGDIGAILEFEKREIFNEDSGQPTSIDLVLTDEIDDPFVFIEFKFTEDGFGGCSLFAAGDCDGRNPAGDFNKCYLHHIGRRYWRLMEKHGFLDERINDERLCVMAQNYQFFRIVLFALEYERPCVLLSDGRSPTFDSRGRDGKQARRGLMPLLLDYVPEGLRPGVKTVTVQEVVAAIRDSGRHSWVNEFEQKYGLDS